jgi:retron-type reverse transcriptase
MRHVQGRAGECHIVARTARQDKVRELQRTLYRAAKADPGRRFHALYDKVYRRDVLERAWELVRANRGAAGIDRQTIADVEQYGVSRLLDELAADLKGGRWRPLPARRVFIPKPGRPTERRPLSIPAVRDRIVQAATKTVIEPIFEADMLECSFGFRPRRSAHDALQVLIADDLLAMCRTRQEAERALAVLTAILAELGLELKDAKTRIVHLTEGGEGP